MPHSNLSHHPIISTQPVAQPVSHHVASTASCRGEHRLAMTGFTHTIPTILLLLLVLCWQLTGCTGNQHFLTKQPVQPQSRQPTVALVLGAGGAKGLAHIGVIQVLNQHGITPDLVVGSSSGSLIGGLYASGKSASELQQLAEQMNHADLLDFTLSKQGIIEGTKLRYYINEQLAGQRIEQLPIRFAAVATQLHGKQTTVFDQGEAGLAIQASCSVPGLFIPPRIPEYTGKKYIDGGVSSPVPVMAARQLGADIVIAVDVLADSTADPIATAAATQNQCSTAPKIGNPAWLATQSLWSLLEQSALNPSYQPSSMTTNRTTELNQADIVIVPQVAHISSINVSQLSALIAAGSDATTEQLAKIQQLLDSQQ